MNDGALMAAGEALHPDKSDIIEAEEPFDVLLPERKALSRGKSVEHRLQSGKSDVVDHHSSLRLPKPAANKENTGVDSRAVHISTVR
jgi:hypothetical protein